jgi:chaperone modulatory protein CbpM
MSTSSITCISFHELCTCTRVSEQQLLGLVEQEIILPQGGDSPEEWEFSVSAVSVAKKAARLHADLVADWEDIPLVLNLLDDVAKLRRENEHLRHRLSRFEDTPLPPQGRGPRSASSDT